MYRVLAARNIHKLKLDIKVSGFLVELMKAHIKPCSYFQGGRIKIARLLYDWIRAGSVVDSSPS